MTPEQQRAIAIAKARRRKAQAEAQTAQTAQSFTPPQPSIGQLPQGYGTGMSALSMPEAGTSFGGIPGIMQEVQQGQQTPQMGKGLVLADAANQAGSWAMDQVIDLTPDAVKQFLGQTIGAAANKVPKSLLEGLAKGPEYVSQWAMENPEKARKAEAMLMIGGAALPARKPFRMQKLYEGIVEPYSNKKNRKAALDQMQVEGLLQTKAFPPSREQQSMMRAVRTVPGIKPGNINSKNYVLIRDHLNESTKKLQVQLDAIQNVKVSKREIRKTLEKAARNVNAAYRKSQRMSDEEITTYIDDVLDQIGEVKTPGALLRARKAVDRYFRTMSNQRRMDPSNALIPTRDEMKWRSARDSLNALLEMKVPGTRGELRRQHMLYKTLDTLADKAEFEPNTAYGRRIKPFIPFIRDKTMTLTPRITQ